MLAILFAQLAVSAYACPCQLPGIAEREVPAAASTMDCESADLASPALCQMHCDYGNQSTHDAPSPLALVSLSPSFVAFLVEPFNSAAQTLTPASVLDRATSTPLAIRNCCFRI